MIKIVSCFWNAEKYIEKCIDSVLSQNNKNFVMFLIDDVSTDKTNSIIRNKINGDNRFKLITNVEKNYKLKNLDMLLRDESMFDDEDIIVELDGDDWFYNNNVLTKIENIYSNNPNLWITNGSFVYSNGMFGFSSKVNPQTIRNDVFTFSHLRTWKVHLWRNIDKKSLVDTKGDYFKAAPDVAYSLPMVEMAGHNHYEFIPDILLVYNEENPFNEHKPGASAGVSEQFKCSQIIKSYPKYSNL